MPALIEGLLGLLAWGFQIGVTMLLGVLLGVLLRGVEQVVRKKRVKLLPRACVGTALVCVLLASLTANPPVICPGEHADSLTPRLHGAVQSVSRGLYSSSIPLIPLCARVTDVRSFVVGGETEHEVAFTIHYLWLGRVGMSYLTSDGYAVTKPLSGLS